MSTTERKVKLLLDNKLKQSQDSLSRGDSFCLSSSRRKNIKESSPAIVIDSASASVSEPRLENVKINIL